MSCSASASSLTWGRKRPRVSLRPRRREANGTHLHDAHDGAERLLGHDLHAVVDVDQDLRRHVRRARLGSREERLVDERLGAFAHCACVTTLSARGTREKERRGHAPASAMCSRIVAAERSEITGPSVVSSSRGSPSLYSCATRSPPLPCQSASWEESEGGREWKRHLDDLDSLLDEPVVDALVHVHALDRAARLARVKHGAVWGRGRGAVVGVSGAAERERERGGGRMGKRKGCAPTMFSAA